MKPPFKYFPVALQIFFLFSLLIICSQGLTQLGYYTLYPLFGVEKPEEFIANIVVQAQYPGAAIWWQTLGSSVGAFVIPSFLFSFLVAGSFADTLLLNRKPVYIHLLYAVVAIVAAGVFISFLVDLSKQIQLPASLQQLEQLQANYDALMKSFFAQSTIPHLFVLILTLAVLPAVGEEMFFRGHIQQLLTKTFMGPYGAIVFSGFIFSLLHFEFRNFLAIWVMGVVLGLIFYYSQSLWVSIAAHFFNNFMEVMLKWLYARGVLASDVAEESSFPIYITLLALVILALSIYLFHQTRFQPLPVVNDINDNNDELE